MEPRDEIALLRYKVIAPLLDPGLRRGEKGAFLKRLSENIYEHPITKRECSFKPETIRHWLKRYKKKGFDGLMSKNRSDKDQVRAIPPEIVQEAVNLKLENPSRTIDGIISILERAGKVKEGLIKRSTLHRIFQNRKINIRKLKPTAVFGRFEAEFPNDTWQSDIMFGPRLPDPKLPGRFFAPQLFAFLDDHSRAVPHAQFYHRSQTSELEHCFRKALQKRGIPKVVYVDNESVFHSSQFLSICAHLGIQLKFARPYSPEGKGKIEKFFNYVRSSFLVEVRTSNIQTLDQLNQAFWAWLEMHYHRKVHSAIKCTPLQRFTSCPGKIRYASEQELKTAFMIKQKKIIHKDCTFQLKNMYYEVMPALVRQEVMVYYDHDDLDSVRVYLAGEFFQVAKPLRIHSKVPPKLQLQRPVSVKTDYHPLADLIKEHKKKKEEKILGPEIIPTPSDGRFTKRDFLSLIDRKGFHLNAFEEREIKRFFDTYGPINNPFARKVLEMAINRCGTGKHISFYLDLLKGDKQ